MSDGSWTGAGRRASARTKDDAVRPCAACGYHVPSGTSAELPEARACPHCHHDPDTPDPHTAPIPSGSPRGIGSALQALPRGLWLLATTRGAWRWLIPPFLLSMAAFVGLWTWTKRTFDHWLDASVPDDVRFERYRRGLEDLPGVLESVAGWLLAGLELFAGAALALFTWSPLQWLGWFLIGSLVLWFAFSIVYEMLAGPFLDEIQARVERRWYGRDPRESLERPTDLSPARCLQLSILAAATVGALFVAGWMAPLSSRWWTLLALPLGLFPWVALEPRFGTWLAWIARIETRAGWASLQATLVTATLIFLALPLYFVPIWGYPAFAVVTGFATSVGLLDIPFARRGWSRRQRWRFLRAHLLAITTFGVLAGLLLSIPVVGPLVLVPASSIGGLWLVRRLDKSMLGDVA